MNVNAIVRIIKFTAMGFVLLVTACSPLVVVQPMPQVPSPTSIPAIVSSPTLQPIVTPTVPPTLAQTDVPSLTPVPVMAGCQDAAQYIGDDGLDGTTYAPNVPFTKTWRIKNSGSCTWDSSYLVFYISGTTMTQSPGYMIVRQGQTVAPGQTVEVSIGMTSPVENGSYRSDWGIKREDGSFLPIRGGANGNAFYVKIKVSNGSVHTTATIALSLEYGSGAACTPSSTYFVDASISADGPTTVSYEMASTAGQVLAGFFQDGYDSQPVPVVFGDMTFTQVDTKAIHYRLVGPYPQPDNISVFIQINGGESYTAKLRCEDWPS